MSTQVIEWSPPDDRSAAGFVPVALAEVRRNPLRLIGLFAAIALGALVVGIVLPKKYTSSTSILVEEGNIIAPLMEGRAVPTGVADRASILKEVAFSRKVMQEILRAGGWLQGNPDPLSQDRLIEQITRRTQVTNPRENLIQIAYTDSDAERAFNVTRRFADLVIEESLATKERESREAYEFIDSQVRQYHRKLLDAEAKLEQYRRTNPDARAGIETDVNARIGELRRMVESGRMDLHDANSEVGALQSQLSGESAVSAVATRGSQVRARMMELQSERDRLLLSYTEQHPDVVRVQHQLADLQEDLRRETEREANRVPARDELASGAAYNPLYAELRSKLAEARRRTAATAARVSSGQALLADELERSRRIAASESTLSELTRDYEVNRDLYQDLLKRRENARVSMNLDAEHRGLSFRIQEPAAVPLRPSGLRLMHVAGAGLAAAIIAPLGLLFAMLRWDPRVRSPGQIEARAGLPVLGAVPALPSRARRARGMRRAALATALLLSVPIAYGLILTLKLVHVL